MYLIRFNGNLLQHLYTRTIHPQLDLATDKALIPAKGGPHDPKWEGYLITAVTDPQKELAETKDAYVSYQISAKVCWFLCHVSSQMTDIEECARQIYQCSPLQIQL